MATTTTRALAERVLTALYAREPHAKVVVGATGGGSSAAELLFRAGSSSTMLQFSVPYARGSLQNFLQEPRDPAADHVPRAKLAQFCSQATSEHMAVAAWKQAQDILRHESEEDDTQHAHAIPATLERFRASVGVACTAALATNYEKRGPHQCFLSICKADLAAAADRSEGNAPFLRQQCETYHLNLSKTLKRTRSEEDHIVSHWLVYLLAKATDTDPAAAQALHEALLSEQHADDKLTELSQAEAADGASASSSDPLQDICAGSCDQLTSVAFLPATYLAEKDHPAVAVKNLDFRGVVLSGSFNPLHQGHVDLARAAQQLAQERSGGIETPIAFEIAVSNADKGVIASSTVMQRVGQFTGASGPPTGSDLGLWPVLVTNATLFSQKASLLKGCAFVIGADTAVRIVDKKYYANDEHKMVLTLQQIARNGCFFVVAGRFDDKVENRYISAEEVLGSCIPAVFQDLFIPLDESAFRSDLSSTQIRNQMKKT